jgi:hypothetical protein
MRLAVAEPTLTLHDIGHDPAAVREQNATRVLAALPGTASGLARATGLAYIAVADAVALLLSRNQARRSGSLTYAKV